MPDYLQPRRSPREAGPILFVWLYVSGQWNQVTCNSFKEKEKRSGIKYLLYDSWKTEFSNTGVDPSF